MYYRMSEGIYLFTYIESLTDEISCDKFEKSNGKL